MNDIFSFNRFRLYFIKTVLERPTMILGTFLLSFTVVFMMYFLFKTIGNIEVAQLLSFTVGLVGGGCLLASLVFGYFADTASGASFLTLPVSSFEKWLCAVILVGVLYLGSYLLYFRAVDSFFVHLFHKNLNPRNANYTAQYNSVYIFTYFGESLGIFIFFLNAAAAMLVGSLYFNKVGFIKVALVICAIFILTFLLNYGMVSVLFKNTTAAFPFHTVNVRNGDDMGVVTMPDTFNRAFDVMSIYVLPAILLVVSFIRLREKEI